MCERESCHTTNWVRRKAEMGLQYRWLRVGDEIQLAPFLNKLGPKAASNVGHCLD